MSMRLHGAASAVQRRTSRGAALPLVQTEEPHQGRHPAVIHPVQPAALLPLDVNDSPDWTLIELQTNTYKHALGSSSLGH
jgi:hypothetical protein